LRNVQIMPQSDSANQDVPIKLQVVYQVKLNAEEICEEKKRIKSVAVEDSEMPKEKIEVSLISMDSNVNNYELTIVYRDVDNDSVLLAKSNGTLEKIKQNKNIIEVQIYDQQSSVIVPEKERQLRDRAREQNETIRKLINTFNQFQEDSKQREIDKESQKIAIEMNDLKNMSDTLVNSQFCGEYQQKVEKINDKLKQIKVSEAAVLGIWLSNENDTLKTEIEKADKNILFLQKSLDAVKTRKPIRDEKKKKTHERTFHN